MHLTVSVLGIGLAVSGLLGALGLGQIAFVGVLITGVLVLAGL